MSNSLDLRQLFAVHARVVGPDLAELTDRDAASPALIAVLAHGIATRLPFATANYATAIAVMVAYLQANGVHLTGAKTEDLQLFLYDLAVKDTGIAAAVDWLIERTTL